MRLRLRLFCVIAASLATACGGGDHPRAGEASLRSNVAPAWPDGRGWTVADSPQVVIGKEDGAGDDQFDGVVGVVRLADGRIVVADGGSREIRYFSAGGKHLATTGGKGDGPGEFRWIDWMGARGDSVYVWDSFATRLTVLGPRGERSRTVHVDGLEMPFPKAAGLMGDGTLVLRPSGALEQDAPLEGERRDSIPYLRVSVETGRVSGRLGRFFLGERFVTRRGGMYLASFVVFGRQGFFAPHSGGFYAGDNERFEITAYGEDGRPLRRLGRPHEPERARPAEVEAHLARLRDSQDFAKLFPGMQRVRELQLARLPHRSTLPAFARVLVDAEGAVWMEEFRADPEAPPAWSVFDAGGRWLGRVATPAGLDVRQIGGPWLIGVRRDELGVERVAVHAIDR